jgi:hypothetical protein
MRRTVATLVLLSIAAAIAISTRAAPQAPVSTSTTATTPTRSDIFVPLIAKPEPPTATPQTTATPTSLPPTFDGCQDDPLAGLAPNYPVRIISINKDAETVTLQNVSSNALSLDSWHMCSIKGNQEHSPIGGTLTPGESRTFGHTGGLIWNNIERDDGALYNQSGSLISYYVDQ